VLTFAALIDVDLDRMSPNRQVVTEGSQVHFHCDSASTPVWGHEGHALLQNVIINQDGSIGIERAGETDAGLYECYGVTSDGKIFVSMGRLIIQSK